MWQTETCTGYRDWLTRLVQLCTSKHISAETVNAGGSGYVTGDVVEVQHAGAAMKATFEVTASAGVVTAVKRRNWGAYSNRVATVAVNAGGSGYPVSTTIILQIEGGTYTERAKVQATTNGSGVVTAVTLFEGGGAYSVAPSATAATTTIVGPSTATTGSGCTIDTTMTTLVGTTGVATTAVTGVGTGLTLDLTLTDTGWTAVRNRNNYSFNSVNDEKEVIMLGTVTGGDAPYIGFRSYSVVNGTDTQYGMVVNAFDNYVDGSTYSSQPNPTPDDTTPASTGQGSYFLLVGALSAVPTSFVAYWSINSRRVVSVAKCQRGSPVTNTSYVSLYCGLMLPYATTTESPYPIAVMATTYAHNRDPFDGSSFVTGITECFTERQTVSNDVIGPAFYRRPSDGASINIANATGTSGSGGTTVMATGHVCYPVGAPTDPASGPDRTTNTDSTTSPNTTVFREGITQFDQGPADLLLFPTLGDNQFLLIPATIISSGTVESANSGDNDNDSTIRGELDNVYWISGTKSDGTVVSSEDTVTIGTKRYRIFQNVHRTERYSFFCLAEE